jgi:hypothetical protein
LRIEPTGDSSKELPLEREVAVRKFNISRQQQQVST